MFGSVPSAILGDKMVALCEMGDRDRRMRKESEDKYCVKKIHDLRIGLKW